MKGTNFEAGVQVYVNGVAALGVWPGTGTSASTVLVFQPPLSAVTGTVDVKVVNPDGGAVTLAGGFDYTSASLGGGSGGGSAPPPTTNGDTFPRLAYLAIGGTQSYNADYQKRAAKFHIAILGGNWEGWENNRGYTMDQVVKNVKAQSKVHTRVFEYVDLNEKANPQKINPNTGTNFKASDSEFSGYWTEVNNMRWWVFNGWNASNGCTGGSNGYGGCVITQDGEDSGGTMAVINMTSSAATDGGLNAYAWGANYVNNLLHAGKMMRAPDPDLDGFFLDNLAPHPYENGDWLHKGSSQSETDTIVDLAFRTGEKAYFDEMSKIWPTGVQFANMGLDSVATDNGVDFTPLKGVMSGGLDEAAIGATWSYEYWSGAARMQNVYRYTWDNIGGPKYIIFGHSHLAANGSDATGNGSGGSITSPAYQGMRYGIAACLMGDGYYAPTLPSGYVSDASVWFDEFDNSGAGEGYLGLPTQSWQTVAWSKGVWKREYQNGIVLWNPKGNGAQTVSLAGLGNLKHLKGTQVPSINNGAVVTNGSVTLQDRDGLILLRY
jgi:hypothetical protein